MDEKKMLIFSAEMVKANLLVSALSIEAMGFKAENDSAVIAGVTPPYGEPIFFETAGRLDEERERLTKLAEELQNDNS